MEIVAIKTRVIIYTRYSKPHIHIKVELGNDMHLSISASHAIYGLDIVNIIGRLIQSLSLTGNYVNEFDDAQNALYGVSYGAMQFTSSHLREIFGNDLCDSEAFKDLAVSYVPRTRI